MALSLRSFFEKLETYPARVPIGDLTALLEKLEVSVDDVKECCQFGEKTYRRNLLHEGSGFQALILCWKSGQRSPIHDHRGSSCGVRVLRGVATETTFHQAPNGMIVAARSRELREGEICGSVDADIHQMSNLQPGDAPLITLHVYTPPLLRMGTYSLTDTEVREYEEPVFEFCHGAGI